MPKRLDELYHTLYKPKELTALKSLVEENHKILIDHISKDDRKIVRKMIDALKMIYN